uniref:Reverse transcriptase domain-containing protein n=1 Tax=Cannabis sativa TaxID=3483 RepID=A0A803QG19_CANSA
MKFLLNALMFQSPMCKIWEWRGGGQCHAPTFAMRCLAWNFRGLRRPAAERALKKLSRGEGFDVIFLMETKIDKDSMVETITRLGYHNCECISSMGTAGGFCVAWKKGFQLRVRHKFNAGFECSIVENHVVPWSLFLIYGTPYGREKRAFWQWLSETVNRGDTNWVVCGDLNVIANAEEKRGGREYHDREGFHLQNFMSDTEGVDLGFIGPRYTWMRSKGPNNGVRKRLDRALASADWCVNFPEATVVNHPILASDHALVVLDWQPMTQKLKYPFRFLEVWTADPGCKDVIQNAWKGICHGQPSFRVCGKLARTKEALKDWNRNVFGFCDVQLRRLYAKLSDLQMQHTDSASVEEAEVQLDILSLEQKMERIWKQKSRELWVSQGDCNSKFFHTSTMIQRRRNNIQAIKDGSRWIFERKEMSDYFIRNFSALFESQHPCIEDDFDTLFEGQVTEEDNVDLCRVSTCEEIKRVVWKLNPLKALGPDGFFGIFYRKYWETVGEDICGMVQDFFRSGRFVGKLSHTFLCLIPKTDNPYSFDHFRPISLCNFSYKVIARIITDRLKLVLDKLVSPLQSAFLPGRWIAECYDLAAEAIHTLNKIRSNRGFMAVKTDMHKAYDRIEWSFLQRVLKANRFNEQFCNLISQCDDGDILDPAKRGSSEIFRSRKGSTTGRRDDFKYLKDKLLARLEGWKAKHLSIAGRQTLINSVMQSIPGYAMSTMKIPVSVCAEMDNIVARFWWKGSAFQGNRYLALKSWADYCQPKRNGGLGFRRFKDMNVALLAKLAWQMLDGETSTRPWVQVLYAKYCSIQDFWCVQEKQSDSRVWRGILSTRDLCVQNAGILVGNGKIDIWCRPWVPGINPVEVRNAFSYNVTHAFSSVSDFFIPGTLRWNESLITRCFSMQVDEAILRIRPLAGKEDTLFWRGNSQGNFSVKNAYWNAQKDCHFARGLWFSCPWGPCSSGLGNLNLEDWFLWLFDTRNELMILYGACIIEHIWNCRNEVIFRGAKANMAASVKIILQRFNEFRSELLEADEPVNTHSDAPRSNLVDGCRFRVDASILDGLAGLGDVQVDAEPDEASVLLHFTAVDSVLEAELRAILSVLTWAREKELNSVFIESDSLIAVKALNSNVLPYAWGSYPVFHECCALLPLFQN